MDEYQESNHQEHRGSLAGAHSWLVVAVVALLCVVIVAFAYGYHQKALVEQFSAQSSTANASVAQLQSQVNTLTAKLNDMTAAQAAAQSSTQSNSPAEPSEQATSASGSQAAPAHVASSKPTHAKRPGTGRRAPVDTKYTQLQAQLAEQQKQLKATQDEVEKNRADLEGSINSTRADLSSTRDDLNGSIARTHDELLVLEKRGERSYFEFDLNKSKQFSRVGPLTLSLRKADTKHKNYNLAMIVDDDQMQKKNVNLFEPIWIHAENESQPVQIVVNKIGKDFVHGYVSAPKYKPSELNTSGGATGAIITPVSAKTPGSTSATPNPQPPPPSAQPQQPQQ
ncbi:MAG TPA: hypothetical protein VE077_19565 [Candidatus Methylomirabilis sp.]|nr:hypothetical protein [Candidatus Methylomirabilis sp.]